MKKLWRNKPFLSSFLPSSDTVTTEQLWHGNRKEGRSAVWHLSPSNPTGPWNPIAPCSPLDPGGAGMPPLPWSPGSPGEPLKPCTNNSYEHSGCRDISMLLALHACIQSYLPDLPIYTKSDIPWFLLRQKALTLEKASEIETTWHPQP